MTAVRETPIGDAPWLARRETQAVFAALAAAGFEARAVGGAVRNTLIGEPVTDVDIATNAPPEDATAACLAFGLKVVPTGLGHGTVTVVSGHVPHEVTTLRRDVETFGRHAKVVFTADWEADARRRDFTMNALYCDAAGRISDWVGGLDDLAQRRVRFIGDAHARIREDYLRILRFFRFSAAYGAGRLDTAGLAAAIAERGGLEGLSAERVRAELLRLLVAPGAVPVVEAMADCGILTRVLGGVAYLGAFARLAAADKGHGRLADPMLRLAALAVRIAEDAERLVERLRLSRAEADALRLAAANPALGCEAGPRGIRSLVYRLGAERAPLALRHAEALDGVSRDSAIGLAASWTAPQLPVAGADLLALGLARGPRVGQVLAELERGWIADDFSQTRAALLERARRLIESEG